MPTSSTETKGRYVLIPKKKQYTYTGPYGAGLVCKNFFWDLKTGLKVTGSASTPTEWPGQSQTLLSVKKTVFRGTPWKDTTSFKKLSRNGRIVMKPYHISGFEEDELYVIGTTTRAVKWAAYLELNAQKPCAGPFIEEESIYERFHPTAFKSTKLYKAEPPVVPDLSDAIARLQGDVVVESYRTFDLLTQVAELRETIGLITDTIKTFTKDFPTYLEKHARKLINNDQTWINAKAAKRSSQRKSRDDLYEQRRIAAVEHNNRMESLRAALLHADTDDKASRFTIREHMRTEERSLRRKLRILNRELRQLSKKHSQEDRDFKIKIDEAVAKKWLEYRYGWVPLVSGVEDLLKYFDKLNNEYKTVRKGTQFIYVTDSFPDDDTGTFKYERITQKYKIGAVGKSFWNSNSRSLRFFDDLGLNPLNTAWEVIPLSFVVDWFFNVQTWLFSKTAGALDFATQRAFCYSVKETVTKETIIHRPAYVTKHSHTVSGYWNGASTSSSKTVTKDITTPLLDGVIHRRTDESFTRHLFTPDDVQLVFEVEMTWKRIVDAFALTHERNKTALLSLKGKNT